MLLARSFGPCIRIRPLPVRTLAALALVTSLGPTALAQFATFTSAPGSFAIPSGAPTYGGGGMWPSLLPSALDQTVIGLNVFVPAGATRIERIRLKGLSHTFVGDLHFVLESPSGTQITLLHRPNASNPDGGGNSCDYTGTYDIVDPASTGTLAWPSDSTVCTAAAVLPPGRYAQLYGNAPAGTWPSGTNGIVNTDLGSIPLESGTWNLRILDWSSGDVGSIESWSMSVDAQAQYDRWIEPGGVSFVPGATPGTYNVQVQVQAVNRTSGPLDMGIDAVISINGVAVDLVHFGGGPNPGPGAIYNGAAGPGGTTRCEIQGPFCSDVDCEDYINHHCVFLPECTCLYSSVDWGQFDAALVAGDAVGVHLVPASGAVFELWEDNDSVEVPFTHPPTTYCTAGITSNGCSASISATANPDVAHSNVCLITTTNVEGQKTGLLFYGLQQHSTPWCIAGSSFLCVKAPTQRGPVQNSGGTAGSCDGTLTLDWNAFQSSHPGALGSPWSVGSIADVQAWFRDPPACKSTSLSNAIELTYAP